MVLVIVILVIMWIPPVQSKETGILLVLSTILFDTCDMVGF